MSLEELKAAASEQYTEKEINDFINMAKILTSKAVLTALIRSIDSNTSMEQHVAGRLIRQVRKTMEYDYSGYVDVEISNCDISLRIQLTLCDADYVASIEVPNDEKFIKDLYDQYNFLKRAAISYWQQYKAEYPDLVAEIGTSDLVIDEKSPTTLYFDPLCPKRIGLFPYYVDAKGNPLRKTHKK